MTTDKRLTAVAAVLVLSLMLVVMLWWLPQKWQGCQKVYESRPAQIICFLSK